MSIVQKLRSPAALYECAADDGARLREAADRIEVQKLKLSEMRAELFASRAARESLHTEVERLREALRGLLDGLDDYWVTLPEGIAAVEAARAALEEA